MKIKNEDLMCCSNCKHNSYEEGYGGSYNICMKDECRIEGHEVCKEWWYDGLKHAERE